MRLLSFLIIIMFFSNLLYAAEGQLIVRKAEKHDVESLVLLTHQLGYSVCASEIENKMKKYENDSSYFLYVAEHNHQVLGYVAISLSEPFIYLQKKMTVDALVVNEKSRGLGIGKKLMETVHMQAEKLNCLMIELTSGVPRKIAHELYYKLGYTDCDRLYFRLYFSKPNSNK